MNINHRHHSLSVLVCFLLILFPALANAQDDPDNSDNPAAATTGDPPDGADPTGSDRTIYVPFKKLQDVFENQNGSVILPYLDYLKLWNKNKNAAAKATPVDAVINEAHYTATVEKDVAKIQAKFKIQVIGKPWAKIPIRFPDAAVGKITSKDNKILLQGLGDGKYSILLPEKGDHEVTIDLVTRVRSSPNGRNLEFGCPAVGITTFEIVVPEADQSLDIKPKLVVLPIDNDDGDQSKFKASLGATTRIAASWNPRASLKPKMDLLTSVTSFARVQIDPGLVHTDATMEFDVLRGELTELELAVPKGHRILDVSAKSGQLKGWKVRDEANRQLVTVELLTAMESKVTIEVHTEFASQDKPFRVAGIDEDGTIHGIHAVGAVRESGQIAVFHGEGLAITVDQQTGVVRMNAKEMAPALRGSGGLTYRFYNPKLNLTLSARAVVPRISATQVSQLVFDDDRLALTSSLNFDITRAGVFELNVRIPQGLKIDSVRSGSMSEYNVDAAGGMLSIALNQKHLGALPVTIQAHQELAAADSNAAPLPLPVLEPTGVVRESGTILVFAPPAIEVVTDEDSLQGVFPSAQNGAAPGRRLVSAWDYSRRPMAISVRTSRKPTRLTASVATTINIEPELHSVRSDVTWTIENAGLDTFRFALPAAAERVQIQSVSKGTAAAIRERTAAEPADGEVIWTVRTQQPITGQQKFSITCDITPQANGDGRATSTIAPPRLLDPRDPVDPADDADEDQRVKIARVTGEVKIEKDRALSVTVAETGDDIEMIDVRELKLVSQTGFTAFRYYRQPVSLNFTAEKHEIQEVVKTVVSRALTEVIINRDPIGTFLCRYRMTSSERQRLRIDLPIGVELHEPLVDGQKAVLEVNRTADVPEGWDSYFVNVARTKASDAPFLLTLQFRAPVGTMDDRPLTGWGGGQELRLPIIGGANNRGVVIQQTRVAVWLPDDFASVKAPNNFVSERPSQISSLWPVRLVRRRECQRVKQLGWRTARWHCRISSGRAGLFVFEPRFA